MLFTTRQSVHMPENEEGSLTHRHPLSEVDLSILVLIRLIDQFEEV